jgi:hypothetical protein
MQRVINVTPKTPRPQSYGTQGIPTEPVKYANLQLYNQVLPPGGQMSLDTGNFFFLLSIALPVNLLIQYPTGSTEIMNGIQPGSQIKRVKTWSRAILAGTAGSLVSFWHGYEFSREDQTNFQSVIATIAGNVTVVPGIGSSVSPTDRADVAVAAGGNAVIAANPLRKSITVGSLSTNAPATTNLRLQGSDAIGGIELQPGTYYNIQTSAALNVHNGDANIQTIYVQEYT